MFIRWFSRIMSFIMLVCSLLGIRTGGKVEPKEEMISYDSGKTAVIISLESNPSTGYNWAYDISDSLIVKAMDDRFISGDNTEIVGAPGTREVTFQGLTAGAATVVFRYLRTWEGEPVRTVTIRITVAADKTLTAELVSDTAAE